MVVYILYSSSLKRYYVGQTANIKDRVYRHNHGHESYTKRGIPWKLVWQCDIVTRSEAMQLEQKIKKRGIKRFLEDINHPSIL